ncbi:MAG: prepilin-type N-terminal cleavage/methylation domain-containing protein [Bdellovibrionales bacterium]|nr:prepilin-type N-terminal cleavage/methylation domain-containing protein [Bdellovibrionales bacterium]
MKYVRNNQAGFSLVELMVVVAIIGILASLAIPSIGKYMAKARQSEAKTQLSSLYTAEKAFFAEYTAYHSMFGAVGYSPEGRLRYNVGFNTVTSQATAANGYNTAPTTAPGNAISTSAYCGAAGAMANNCSTLNGATNTAPAAISAVTGMAAMTTNTFVAGATAVVHQSGGNDDWTINEQKLLLNTRIGIP